MSIDSIGNFLTIIRNGLRVRKRTVTMPFSQLKMHIARVLKEEGYIKEYEKIGDEKKPAILVTLKYFNGEPVIREITRISKPGRRYYEGKAEVRSVIGGLGISILTTSSGVMTDRHARSLGVGGEVLCHVC